MALTPTTAWLAAAERSPNEPCVLLKIYDGTTTWRAVDRACGHSDFATTDIGLAQHAPLAEEVDPFTRTTQIGSITVTVPDAWFRPIAVNNRIWGQQVTLELGFYGLAEADYMSLFLGAVEGYSPKPGGVDVDIRCTDIFTILQRHEIVGYWAGVHPLEAAVDIIEKSGVPAALIDYLSMTPSGIGEEEFSGVGLDDMTSNGTYGAYTDTAEAVFVVTIDASVPSPDTFAWTKDGAGGAAGVGITGAAQALSDGVEVTFAAIDGHTVADNWTINTSPKLKTISHWNCSRGGGHQANFDDFVIRKPMSAHTLLDGLAAMLNGMWARNEEGQITFLPFDNSTAAADHWDDDVIRDLNQLDAEENLVNEVTVLYCRNQEKGYKQEHIYDDDDSQSNFAFPGTTDRIVSEKFNVNWLDHTKGQLGANITDIALSMTIISESIHGLTGCRWPGFGTAAGVSQAAWAQLSATNVAWFLIKDATNGDEIVKATASTPYSEIQFQTRDPVTDAYVSHGPYPARLTNVVIVRGQLGTAGVAHARNSPVYDMTIPHYMAKNRIDRFGAGAPRVEVTTPLSKAWLQYGDLMTLEHAPYLAYGIDGVVLGDGKWEVTLKEPNIYDAEPHCRWVLTFAGTSSPTTTTDWRRGNIESLANDTELFMEEEDVARPYFSDGFGVTQTAGLAGSVAAGTITNGTSRKKLEANLAHTFTANKDTYVVVSLLDGGVRFVETALAAGRPAYTQTERETAKVTTDGAGITAIDSSQKPLTAIDGVKLIDDTVDTAQIAPLAVQTAELGLLSVDTPQIAAAAVENAKIGLLAVDTPQIAAAAVENAKLGLLAVDTPQIAAGAVENAKIGLLAVDTAQLAAGAVETAKIDTSAVTTAKVGDGAVGIAKMDLAQQYGGPLNANAALTMYSNG